MMKLPRLIPVLLLGAAALGSAHSVRAQHEARREYVQFPINPDAAALVKERLRSEQQLAPFKDLVRQILADPDNRLGINPKTFKDVKLDDPELRKAVQAWAASDPELQKAIHAWVKKESPPDTQDVQRELKQLQRELWPNGDFVQQILADPAKFGLDPKFFKDVNMYDPTRKRAFHDRLADDPKVQQMVRERFHRMTNRPTTDAQKLGQELKQVFDQGAPPPNEIKAPIERTAIEPKVDPLAQAAESAMLRVEKTKLGDWLVNSEAWNRAFRDLRGSLNNSDNLKAKDWPSKLGISQDRALHLTEDAMQRLRDLPTLDPNRWKWERPIPALSPIPAPNLAAPELPAFDSPAFSTVSATTFWSVLIAILLFAVWRLRHWGRGAATRKNHRAALGAWPVQPDAISTRTQLVQAFDYLALWSLGFDVRSWNHLAIARFWSAQAPACTHSACVLAELYEQARYTPGTDELSAAQRDQARRSLRQLAESL